MKEYIDATKPAFAIGEYWDSLAYEGGQVSYNQGSGFTLTNLLTTSQTNVLKFNTRRLVIKSLLSSSPAISDSHMVTAVSLNVDYDMIQMLIGKE